MMETRICSVATRIIKHGSFEFDRLKMFAANFSFFLLKYVFLYLFVDFSSRCEFDLEPINKAFKFTFHQLNLRLSVIVVIISSL